MQPEASKGQDRKVRDTWDRLEDLTGEVLPRVPGGRLYYHPLGSDAEERPPAMLQAHLRTGP